MMQPDIPIDRPEKWLTTDYKTINALYERVMTLYNSEIKQLFYNA